MKDKFNKVSKVREEFRPIQIVNQQKISPEIINLDIAPFYINNYNKPKYMCAKAGECGR